MQLCFFIETPVLRPAIDRHNMLYLLRFASPAGQYLLQQTAQIGRVGFRQLQDTRYICLLLTV